MPTYEVTDPKSGRVLQLIGTAPPTDQDLDGLFAQYKNAPKPEGLWKKTKTVLGKIADASSNALNAESEMMSNPANAEILGSLATGVVSLAPAVGSMLIPSPESLKEWPKVNVGTELNRRLDRAKKTSELFTSEANSPIAQKALEPVSKVMGFIPEKANESSATYNQWADEASTKGDYGKAVFYKTLSEILPISAEAANLYLLGKTGEAAKIVKKITGKGIDTIIPKKMGEIIPETQGKPTSITPDVKNELLSQPVPKPPQESPVGMAAVPPVETLKESKVNVPPKQPTATSQGKQPWEMSKKEFDTEEAKGMGASWLNATKTDEGKIIAYGSEHGDMMGRIADEGLIAEDLGKPQYRGWIWGNDKSTFIDVSDLEKSGGDFHKAYLNKAIAEGKPIPESVFKDYPDLQKAQPQADLTTEARKYKTAEEFVMANTSSLKNAETGKPIVASVYHGTPDARFLPEFDANKKGYYKNVPDALADNTKFIELHGGINQGFKNKSVTGNIGISLTDNRRTAQSYANKPAFDNQNSIPMVVERYADLKNPKVIDLKGQEWKHTVGKDIEQAMAEGHDGLILKNIKDDYHPSDSKSPSNNVIVFDSANLKTKSQLADIWNKAQEGKVEAKVEIPKAEPIKPEIPKVEPLKPAETPENFELKSRVFDRLKQEHPEELKGDLNYTKINLEKDAERATELISSDKQQAYRLAMNMEESPNVTNTAVNIAMSEKALTDGNLSLYGKLVKNRSLAQTRRGQEIVSEKGSVTDNSTSRYVREVVAARLEKVGKNYFDDLKGKLVKKSNKQKGIDSIDKEVTKAQDKMANKVLDIKEAQSLIDKLMCK